MWKKCFWRKKKYPRPNNLIYSLNQDLWLISEFRTSKKPFSTKAPKIFSLKRGKKSPNPIDSLLFKVLLEQTCSPLAAPFPLLKGLLKTFLPVYTRDKENDLENRDTEDSVMGKSAKEISKEFWDLNTCATTYQPVLSRSEPWIPALGIWECFQYFCPQPRAKSLMIRYIHFTASTLVRAWLSAWLAALACCVCGCTNSESRDPWQGNELDSKKESVASQSCDKKLPYLAKYRNWCGKTFDRVTAHQRRVGSQEIEAFG